MKFTIHKRNLLGRGMLDRIRTTGFAMLGATSLLGLALVVAMLQLGVNSLPSLPLPHLGSDRDRGAIGSAVAVDEASPTPNLTPAPSAGADAAPPQVRRGADRGGDGGTEAPASAAPPQGTAEAEPLPVSPPSGSNPSPAPDRPDKPAQPPASEQPVSAPPAAPAADEGGAQPEATPATPSGASTAGVEVPAEEPVEEADDDHGWGGHGDDDGHDWDHGHGGWDSGRDGGWSHGKGHDWGGGSHGGHR